MKFPSGPNCIDQFWECKCWGFRTHAKILHELGHFFWRYDAAKETFLSVRNHPVNPNVLAFSEWDSIPDRQQGSCDHVDGFLARSLLSNELVIPPTFPLIFCDLKLAVNLVERPDPYSLNSFKLCVDGCFVGFRFSQKRFLFFQNDRICCIVFYSEIERAICDGNLYRRLETVIKFVKDLIHHRDLKSEHPIHKRCWLRDFSLYEISILVHHTGQSHHVGNGIKAQPFN